MAGEIAAMKGESPDAMAKLARGIERAVKESFESGSIMVFQTQHEHRRRAQLCIAIAREIRNELGWSADRIADAMPRALRAKLDGTKFDPEQEQKRATWAAAEA